MFRWGGGIVVDGYAKTLCAAPPVPYRKSFPSSRLTFRPNFSFSSLFPVRSLLLSYIPTLPPIRLFSFSPLIPSVTHSPAWRQLLISIVVCPAPVVGDNYSNGSTFGVVVAGGQVKIQLSGEHAGWTMHVEKKNEKKHERKKKALDLFFGFGSKILDVLNKTREFNITRLTMETDIWFSIWFSYYSRRISTFQRSLLNLTKI